MKLTTVGTFYTTIVVILLGLLSCLEEVESARVWGKFDRFGKNRRQYNLGLGPYRHTGSDTYYHNEEGAKIIKESHFETEYELGRKIVFFCTAVGNPRPHITWYKYNARFRDGVELYAHNWLQIHEWVESETQLKSKMEIDPATQMDRGDYECLADNKWAIDRRRFRTDYEEMD